MKVELFPGGYVHSAYLDLINHPPEGVEYVGVDGHGAESGFVTRFDGVGRGIFDRLRLPYVIGHIGDVDMVHSSQKLLLTDKPWVVDIEHGNPFMGAEKVFKYRWPQFKYVVNKILKKENCRMVLPWTDMAARAFRENFNFLGPEFLYDNVKVVRPATEYIGRKQTHHDFTFTFVGGSTWDTFYSKGGIQTLGAFDLLEFAGYDVRLNFISRYIPDVYKRPNNKTFQGALGLSRDKLMHVLENTDVLVIPSHMDTYGMILLEAKARGVPAIVVDNFAACEMVETYHTGLIIERDCNVDPWFDDLGRKNFGKWDFHNQFRYQQYFPDFCHVVNLAYAMKYCADNRRKVRAWGKNCLEEVKGGKFSIKERNRRLADAYGL